MAENCWLTRQLMADSEYYSQAIFEIPHSVGRRFTRDSETESDDSIVEAERHGEKCRRDERQSNTCTELHGGVTSAGATVLAGRLVLVGCIVDSPAARNRGAGQQNGEREAADGEDEQCVDDEDDTPIEHHTSDENDADTDDSDHRCTGKV